MFDLKAGSGPLTCINEFLSDSGAMGSIVDVTANNQAQGDSSVIIAPFL